MVFVVFVSKGPFAILEENIRFMVSVAAAKMATAVYLEHYLDSTESLPRELQRTFQLIREPDQRTRR